jgi:hypothetical protein
VAWNQYVPETKGFTCDWTQKRPDAGKYKMWSLDKLIQFIWTNL